MAICTEWQDVIPPPDFDVIKAEFKMPIVVDDRSLFKAGQLKTKRIEYYAVGRGLLKIKAKVVSPWFHVLG